MKCAQIETQVTQVSRVRLKSLGTSGQFSYISNSGFFKDLHKLFLYPKGETGFIHPFITKIPVTHNAFSL